MESVSDGFSTDASDRTREQVQLWRSAGVEWETDYNTDVNNTGRRKGRRVIKSDPDWPKGAVLTLNPICGGAFRRLAAQYKPFVATHSGALLNSLNNVCHGSAA